MIRRTEHLVRQIRRQSDNKILGNDDGISTEEILQYLNEGQEDIQQAILQTHNNAFVYDDTVDTIPGQEAYDNPPLAFGNQGLVRVDFAYGGPPDDYRPLKKVTVFEERTYRGTAPWQYIPLAGRYLINPVPDSVFNSGLRRWYNKVVPRLDIRRSVVDTFAVGGGLITALKLDPTYVDWATANFNEDDFLCIVDRDGNILTRSIEYNYIDPITGDVTLIPAGHQMLNGENLAAGDYVVRGYYATTNSELAGLCEKYLIQYGAWRIYGRDESDAIQRESATLAMMKKGIVDAYGEINGDIDRIPAIDYDYSEYL